MQAIEVGLRGPQAAWRVGLEWEPKAFLALLEPWSPLGSLSF